MNPVCMGQTSHQNSKTLRKTKYAVWLGILVSWSLGGEMLARTQSKDGPVAASTNWGVLANAPTRAEYIRNSL